NVERRIVELLSRYAERFGEERISERPAVEHELDVERSAQALLDLGERRIGEAACFQRRGIDRGRLSKRGVADGVGFDLCKRAFSVAERAQGFRHRLVDDFEV